MAPVRQLICVSYVEKSTNIFRPKMRQVLLDEFVAPTAQVFRSFYVPKVLTKRNRAAPPAKKATRAKSEAAAATLALGRLLAMQRRVGGGD